MTNETNQETPLETGSGSIFSKQWNMADEENNETEPLRGVSILAILAFIGGLFSFLVFLSPSFYFIPAVSFLLAVVSLIRIRMSDGNLIGRGFALMGLWLLIIPCVAVPVKNELYRMRYIQDGKRFVQLWFKTVAEGNILRVKQLGHVPHCVSPSMTPMNYWRQYTGDELTHEELHTFLGNKLLLTLEALGDKAKATYYKTEYISYGKESEDSLVIYAVTYPNEKGDTETFFVQFNISRSHDAKRGIGLWKGGDKVKGPLKLDGTGAPVIDRS